MKYDITILPRAKKELTKIPPADFDRIVTDIKKLSDEPRPQNCIKLKGREGWRIRCGNYRVIYEIDDTLKSILILHVGHRKDVYD